MRITSSPSIPYLQKELIDDGAGVYPNKIAFEVEGEGTSVNNIRVDVVSIGAAGAAANYVFPPAGGMQMAVRSSSVNDTAAGTGVRTVHIHYLDDNYATQQEIVTLNGTSLVNTVATNILRVNDFHTVTAGSGAQAAGDITLENTAGTVIYSRISTGMNRARNAVFTIPAGKQGYITHWNASSGTTNGTHYTRFVLRATTHENTLYPGIFMSQDATGTLNSATNIDYDIPLHLPATTDIKVSVISDSGAANAVVNSHFSGWYE